MEKLREHSSDLVEQADIVAHELIRVAVSWHELWHEGLEEASRLYFGDDDVEGMFATLEPLHAMLEKGAETLSVGFVATPDHIAEAYLYLVRADYANGTLVTIGMCLTLQAPWPLANIPRWRYSLLKSGE